MRTLLISLAAALCLCVAQGAQTSAQTAQAERRIFVIAGDGNGYGIDRCLAAGDKCGTAAANAYCKSHEFAAAMSFRKVDRDDITGATPAGGASGCRGPNCDDIVAIVCTR